MPITEQQVLDALKELTDPNTRKDYVTSKSARNVKVESDKVSVDILLGYPAKSQIEPIRREIAAKLRTLPGVVHLQQRDRSPIGVVLLSPQALLAFALGQYGRENLVSGHTSSFPEALPVGHSSRIATACRPFRPSS